MKGTRILKIDLDLAEIIEVKVATCNTKIIFFPLSSIIAAIPESIFKILVPIM